MLVVRLQDAFEGLGPGLLEELHQPLRMGGSSSELSVDPAEKIRLLGDKSTQDGIHQAARARLAEYPRRVHCGMHRCLRSVARIFDLVSADDQQGADFVRDPLGP